MSSFLAAVPRDVLAWLAEHFTGGGRQLDGALTQLEVLASLHRGWLDVATVAQHFRTQADAGRPIDRERRGRRGQEHRQQQDPQHRGRPGPPGG